MSGRHRTRRSAHRLPGTASSPALSGAADVVLDLVDPAPDATPEQWLDGLRSGWTRDSRQLAADALHRRHIKPLHVAEVRAERKAQQDTAEGNDMFLAIGLGIAAAAIGATAAVVHFTGRAAEAAWNAARKAARRAP